MAENFQGNKSGTNDLPKGYGISLKLTLSVLITAIALITFIVIAIFTYRSDKPDAIQKNAQSMLAKQQDTITPESEIENIEHGKHNNGILTTKGQKAGVSDGGQSVQSAKISNEDSTKSGIDQDRVQSVLPATTTAEISSSAASDSEKMQAAKSNISVVNNFNGPAEQVATAGGINHDIGAGQDKNDIPNVLGELPSLTHGEDYQKINMQSEKIAFLHVKQVKDDKFYLGSTLAKSFSPYTVKGGTIIAATLITGIDSDLPGQIIAQVSRNIYDTVTGNYLLIPQGTKVLGAYDSQVAYGQKRVLIVWSRLIYPNGDSFDLEGQPGVDLAGMAGLHDLVDNHYVRIFGSALLFSVFGALGQLSQPQQVANGSLTNQQIIYGAVGQELTQVGAQLIAKNINIQPTINIRPGANFNILLTRDMVLPGVYEE